MEVAGRQCGVLRDRLLSPAPDPQPQRRGSRFRRSRRYRRRPIADALDRDLRLSLEAHPDRLLAPSRKAGRPVHLSTKSRSRKPWSRLSRSSPTATSPTPNPAVSSKPSSTPTRPSPSGSPTSSSLPARCRMDLAHVGSSEQVGKAAWAKAHPTDSELDEVVGRLVTRAVDGEGAVLDGQRGCGPQAVMVQQDQLRRAWL